MIWVGCAVPEDSTGLHNRQFPGRLLLLVGSHQNVTS